MEWDRPVREYLPDFRLYDDFATAEMTPRDLVSHRSGLPRHDNVWYGRPRTRTELLERLRYLEPSASFRSRYQYQNLMFMVAGHLAERIAGTDWHRLVDERIFTPLGMDRSNTSVGENPASGDYALPYVPAGRRSGAGFLPRHGPRGSGRIHQLERRRHAGVRPDPPGRPASSRGRRIISAESSARMQEPQFAMPGQSEFPELGQVSYGLGLRVGSYRGRKAGLARRRGRRLRLVHVMAAAREDRRRRSQQPLGGHESRSGDSRLQRLRPSPRAFPRSTGTPATSSCGRSAGPGPKRARATWRRGARRVTQPSLELAAYAGRYRHPAYGTIEVRAGEDRLEIVYDGFRIGLEHYHYDVFRISTRPAMVPVTGLVAFSTGESGEVVAVAVPFEPNAADIVFERAASR